MSDDFATIYKGVWLFESAFLLKISILQSDELMNMR